MQSSPSSLDNGATRGSRRPALFFVLITVTLDMLALGMIIPVLPPLIVTFAGGDTAEGARVLGAFGTAWALMQFVFSPVLGSLSDRFGRRPVILLSNFGLGLDYMLMAMAPTLAWLFVGRLVSGITAASISTAGAYIADVSPPDKRASGFGLLGAAFGVGFILGPAIGGLLATFGPRVAFWVAAGFSLANAAYGLFILPESLSIDKRSAFSWRRANPFGALSLLRSQRELWGLSLMSFLGNLAHGSLPAVFVLYAGYRYGWREHTVGLTLGAVGLASIIVQGGLVHRVVGRFGERRVLLAGVACGAIGFAIYGLAPTGAAFWLGIPVMALWGLANPAAQGLMTRRVAATEQGQLQGALSCVLGIAGLISPTLFAVTFAAFIDPEQRIHLPGAPYLLAASFLVASFAVGVLATRTEGTSGAMP